MAKRRVTLRDVARRAGVHSSTVSRALNSETRDMISREVVQKVSEAAAEMGYRLNPFARSLKTNRSYTVGVLIPDLTDPLFPPITRGIEDVLSASGYTAILANSDNDPGHERTSLDAMRARKVDGFVLATARRADELVDECLDDNIPLVLVNRQVDNPQVPSVVNDDVAGMRMAVDHVWSLGHRRIAHLAGPQNFSTGYMRRRGYLEAMHAHGLDASDQDIAVAASFREDDGYKAVMALLRPGQGYTAIVTANDVLALGCYDALTELGLSCPDDISITGFNDMPFIDKFRPPLTSVRIQHFEMGAKAAELLLRLMKGEDVGRMTVMLKPELVIRASTAPPPA